MLYPAARVIDGGVSWRIGAGGVVAGGRCRENINSHLKYLITFFTPDYNKSRIYGTAPTKQSGLGIPIYRSRENHLIVYD